MKSISFMRVSQAKVEGESIFDFIPIPICLLDNEYRILRINMSLAKRLRKTPEEVVGKKYHLILKRANLPIFGFDQIRKALAGEIITDELSEVKNERTFRVVTFPFYSDRRECKGVIYIAIDVTKERIQREKLQQIEKLSALGRLISSIVHQLNNALTPIIGYSQFLLEKVNLEQGMRMKLERILNRAQWVEKMVKNLTLFARERKPIKEWTDINDILRISLNLAYSDFKEKRIRLIKKLSPSLPSIMADPRQLQEVFLNLIFNANQAMFEAHGEGKLWVGSYLDIKLNKVVIKFKDNGPGISPENLNGIFDPFFTIKGLSKSFDLGLSASYGVIKEHRGDIYAKSRSPQGTTFVIELPIT